MLHVRTLGGTNRCPLPWKVSGVSQMQLQQRHVATRVWKVLEAPATTDCHVPWSFPPASVTKVPEVSQTLPQQIANHYDIHNLSRTFSVSLNIGKEYEKSRHCVNRTTKQTRHQQSSRSTFSHVHWREHQNCCIAIPTEAKCHVIIIPLGM